MTIKIILLLAVLVLEIVALIVLRRAFAFFYGVGTGNLKPAAPSNENLSRFFKSALRYMIRIFVGLNAAACIAGLVLYFVYPLGDDDSYVPLLEKREVLAERGQYLVNNVLLCNECHSQRDWSRFSGPIVEGHEGEGIWFNAVPGLPGKFYAANLTPHNLGTWSDKEIYTVLSSGISKDGHPIFPIMPYTSYGKLTDRDLQAVVVYLRTLRPIVKASPQSTIDFPANLLLRAAERKPEPTPAEELTTSLGRGKYLVNVADCRTCHTPPKGTGLDEARNFGGGREFLLPSGGRIYSANITPDVDGIGNWTRDAFITKFKNYSLNNAPRPVKANTFNTVMSWEMYSGMSESDLGAIYDYLKSLKPVSGTSAGYVPDK